MHFPLARRLTHAAATLCVLALLGCTSQINQANFDRIRTGMTRTQVRAILGRPSESSAMQFGGFSGTVATWKARDGATISVQFLNDRVQGKQFYSDGR